MIKKLLLTLVLAILGGWLFTILHIPVPWLLGPMIVPLFCSIVLKWDLEWSKGIRDAGIIIVGYTIGQSMTASALKDMGSQLPFMLLVTLLLLALSAGIAFLISKISDQDYLTLLLASTPGGLSQMVVVAEETKGINMAVVTITQVIRLMMVILLIPFLVTLPLFSDSANLMMEVTETVSTGSWRGLFPSLFVFAPICIGLAFLANKLKVPTAFLIGPAIGTALLQGFVLEAPQLTPSIMNAAQLMLGTHVGLILKPNEIPRDGKTFSLAIGSGVFLMIGAVILSLGFTNIQPVSNATALLSLAPGGMDQMGIIAHAIHADLSIVSGYQLFRTLFIFFFIPPFIRFLAKSVNRKREEVYKRKTS